MACSNENCSIDGVWRPVFELRARKNGPITRVWLTQLVYCDVHKEGMTLAMLLSAEGFVKLAKYLRENGKGTVIQRNTTLAWERLAPELLETITPLIIAEPNPDDDLAF